jgi:hypothetical protein
VHGLHGFAFLCDRRHAHGSADRGERERYHSSWTGGGSCDGCERWEGAELDAGFGVKKLNIDF